MADLEIPLLDPDAPVRCGTCDWSGSWSQTPLRIVDMPAVTAIADRIPAGLCPECGKLAFLISQDRVDDHGLSYAARALFPHYSGLQAGLSTLIESGEITAANMGEHWNWLKSTIEQIEMKEHEVLVAELERILDSD